MIMSKLAFDVVTPDRLVIAKEVDMAVIPGTEGDFGVLRGHAPVISSVRPGVIRTYDGDTVAGRFLVTGGFAEVTNERCTVLATEVFDFADTKKEHLEDRVKAMQKIHKQAKDDQEEAVAASNISVAEQALNAYIMEMDANY